MSQSQTCFLTDDELNYSDKLVKLIKTLHQIWCKSPGCFAHTKDDYISTMQKLVDVFFNINYTNTQNWLRQLQENHSNYLLITSIIQEFKEYQNKDDLYFIDTVKKLILPYLYTIHARYFLSARYVENNSHLDNILKPKFAFKALLSQNSFVVRIPLGANSFVIIDNQYDGGEKELIFYFKKNKDTEIKQFSYAYGFWSNTPASQCKQCRYGSWEEVTSIVEALEYGFEWINQQFKSEE